MSPGNSSSASLSFDLVICILKFSPGHKLNLVSFIIEHKGCKIKRKLNANMLWLSHITLRFCIFL